MRRHDNGQHPTDHLYNTTKPVAVSSHPAQYFLQFCSLPSSSFYCFRLLLNQQPRLCIDYDKREGILRDVQRRHHDRAAPTLLKHQNGTHAAAEVAQAAPRTQQRLLEHQDILQVYLQCRRPAWLLQGTGCGHAQGCTGMLYLLCRPAGVRDGADDCRSKLHRILHVEVGEHLPHQPAEHHLNALRAGILPWLYLGHVGRKGHLQQVGPQGLLQRRAVQLHQGGHFWRLPLHVLRGIEGYGISQTVFGDYIGHGGHCTHPSFLDHPGEAADPRVDGAPRLQGAPHPVRAEEDEGARRLGEGIGAEVDQETSGEYAHLPHFRDHGGLQARGLSLFNDVYTVQEAYSDASR